MNKARLVSCVCFLFVAFFADAKFGMAQSEEKPYSVSWQLLGRHVENDNALYASIKITNNRAEVLGNSDWAFYFNRYPSHVLPESIQGNVNFDRISGGFFRITPKPDFAPLKQGETATILYGSHHPLVKTANGPPSGYFLFKGSDDAIETNIDRVQSDVDIISLTGNQHWIITPEQRFQTNQTIAEANQTIAEANQAIAEANQAIVETGIDECPITPTPISFEKGEGMFELSDVVILRCPRELKTVAQRVQIELKKRTGVEIKIWSDAAVARKPLNKSIDLYLDDDAGPESYQLTVNSGGVEIRGDAAGVFYATNSLISLITSGEKSGSSINCKIKDAPRFPYRGLHIDVARNFHSKANLLQIIEQMAFYKLNKLHLHLCDDEGWRLEIAGLPELTEVGGRRGHTVDESDHLFPAYSSGPNVDATSAGSGSYSREDFIEILKFATERHIEVIPEIDFPGHARAAIVAMKRRHERLLAAGDEEAANEFLLTDPNDQSEYWSVQYYNDNVICPVQPGVFRFFTAVVDDMLAMYQAAGAKLSIVHTGGDEVPAGVWQKSPLCQTFIKDNDDVEDVTDLTYLFLARLADVLDQRNIQLAGWEEIALKVDQHQGHKEKLPNPNFADRKFIPYIWNSVIGWKGEELGYQLANAGYPVVLCNGDRLYLSLAPVIDTDEPGYFWAGLTPMKTVFEFTPMDIYKTARTERNGKPVNRAERFSSATRLTDAGRKNVLGIQGEIWSETLRDESLLEDRLYPRLLPLAQRAWSPQPEWAKTDDIETLDSEVGQAFAKFSNRIDQHELKRLTEAKIEYHLPEPGVIESDGKIMANVRYPHSLKIRFTTDGTQPTDSSPEYKEAIPSEPGQYRFAAFSSDGRSSDGVTLDVKP